LLTSIYGISNCALKFFNSVQARPRLKHLQISPTRLETTANRFVKAGFVTEYTEVNLPVSMRFTLGQLFCGGIGLFQTTMSLVLRIPFHPSRPVTPRP
jgi:hypothetical protein